MLQNLILTAQAEVGWALAPGDPVSKAGRDASRTTWWWRLHLGSWFACVRLPMVRSVPSPSLSQSDSRCCHEAMLSAPLLRIARRSRQRGHVRMCVCVYVCVCVCASCLFQRPCVAMTWDTCACVWVGTLASWCVCVGGAVLCDLCVCASTIRTLCMCAACPSVCRSLCNRFRPCALWLWLRMRVQVVRITAVGQVTGRMIQGSLAPPCGTRR
jgi:hypothetical protein